MIALIITMIFVLIMGFIGMIGKIRKETRAWADLFSDNERGV